MTTASAPSAVIACLSTCPDAATARRIAETLVQERLAACVNLLPGVHSIYRWHDAVEHAEEVLLLAKTTPGCLAALQARLLALHPYELPELLVVEAGGGLPAYLAWIADNVSPPGSAGRLGD